MKRGQYYFVVCYAQKTKFSGAGESLILHVCETSNNYMLRLFTRFTIITSENTEVFTYVCTLQKRLHTHKIQGEGINGYMHLLRKKSTALENVRPVQGLQNNRPGTAKADRPEIRKWLPVQDVCVPFLRALSRYCGSRTLTEEQKRPIDEDFQDYQSFLRLDYGGLR